MQPIDPEVLGYIAILLKICNTAVLNFAYCSALCQDCPNRQEIQGMLKQVQKLLSAHEASCLQSLRNLRKKINLLQSGTGKQTAKSTNSTCPKLDAPINGRKLGKSHGVGHEVHFLCDPGYEIVGSESRVCQESLTWTGQQPTCRGLSRCASSPCLNGGTCVDEVNQFSCVCAKGWAGETCQSPVPTSATTGSNSNYKCLFGMSDVCSLSGKLCLHKCVNTPGGYRCSCPAGYNVTRDGRSCKDIDECATRQNNCTNDQMCVNTYGGFQCVRVDCPKIPHATYVKTSPMRCERNPCPLDNKACSQTPTSFSYHYLAVVSNLSAPRVMFRVSALRQLGDTLRFTLLGGRQARRHFTVQRSDRQTGQLMLVSPVQGPTTLEAEVEMSELERRVQLGRYITKITMFVSQYEF
uniref:Fibulin-7-like n=1 Tax=Poecilia latipinna TaxID=48699 RepID=A0A3B3V6D3_9TELE